MEDTEVVEEDIIKVDTVVDRVDGETKVRINRQPNWAGWGQCDAK